MPAFDLLYLPAIDRLYLPAIDLLYLPAIDLLEKMLELDADKRITAEQILSHPYLAQVGSTDRKYNILHRSKVQIGIIILSTGRKYST